MNDFNIKQFLVENKMTRNSRLLSENTSREEEIKKIIDDKVRQWRMDAGAQSVMIDDMPEEAMDDVMKKFRDEAESEIVNLSENTWSAKLYGIMPGAPESEMVDREDFATKEEAEAFISGKEGTWDIEYNFTDDQLNALDQYEKTGLYPEEMSDEDGDYLRDLWRSEQGYEDFTDPAGGSGLDSHV